MQNSDRSCICFRSCQNSLNVYTRQNKERPENIPNPQGRQTPLQCNTSQVMQNTWKLVLFCSDKLQYDYVIVLSYKYLTITCLHTRLFIYYTVCLDYVTLLSQGSILEILDTNIRHSHIYSTALETHIWILMHWHENMQQRFSYIMEMLLISLLIKLHKINNSAIV